MKDLKDFSDQGTLNNTEGPDFLDDYLAGVLISSLRLEDAQSKGWRVMNCGHDKHGDVYVVPPGSVWAETANASS